MDVVLRLERDGAESAGIGHKQQFFRNRRERILFCCIGSVFGASMVGLLIGMCFTEVSIHRDVARTSNEKVTAPYLAMEASR